MARTPALLAVSVFLNSPGPYLVSTASSLLSPASDCKEEGLLEGDLSRKKRFPKTKPFRARSALHVLEPSRPQREPFLLGVGAAQPPHAPLPPPALVL
ncbi:hypothetical protein TREES_T100012207 [Tupaia chinensis]|uniref:Uncharacterized protein n=1 Tax=Tupaia chinensis TaxID=246437 RepID=L9JH06_TUPCH|nr:hypothetical protein TREES_T100012207 [Tupaia chinensis]